MPARDTLCLKGSLEYEVQGSGGGGLLYEWFVTFKDGKRELKLKQEGLEFESNSVLITGPIDETWDSAYIVCRASNDCGIDSMKMLLLVEKSRELIVHPSPDTTVCAGGYAHIRVELKTVLRLGVIFTRIHLGGKRHVLCVILPLTSGI